MAISNGVWQFLDKTVKIILRIVLAYGFVFVVGCTPSAQVQEVTNAVSSPSTAVTQIPLSSSMTKAQGQASPTNIANSPSNTVDSTKYASLPTWEQVVLPIGCDLAGITPDQNWLVVNKCLPVNNGRQRSYKDSLVQVKSDGEIERIIPFPLDIGLAPDYELAGFTPDSKHMIIQEGENFRLLSIPELRSSPFAPATIGSFVYNKYGDKWQSPYGWRYLGFKSKDYHVFSIFDTRDVSWFAEDVAWLRGTQFNWCGSNDEVVFIEGDEEGKMSVWQYSISDWTKRAIIESTSPLVVNRVSCSPDQRWIAVGQHDFDRNEHNLWLIDRSSGSQSKFSYLLRWDASYYDGWNDLIWSPDSHYLTYLGRRSGVDDEFNIIEIPSGEVLPRDFDGEVRRPIAWSQDGKSLLAYNFKKDGILPQVIVRWITVVQ